jgi:tetratricopeptide (TPR) repeat protein
LKVRGGDTLGQARTWNNIVLLYGEQGAMDKAIEAARRAAELFADVFTWRDAGNAWLTLARVHEVQRSYEDADAALRAAIDAYTHAHANDEVQRAKDEFETRRRFVHRVSTRHVIIISIAIFVVFLVLLALALPARGDSPCRPNATPRPAASPDAESAPILIRSGGPLSRASAPQLDPA